jgi:hypothetical protein
MIIRVECASTCLKIRSKTPEMVPGFFFFETRTLYYAAKPTQQSNTMNRTLPVTARSARKKTQRTPKIRRRLFKPAKLRPFIFPANSNSVVI